jgi:predicted RNase H-like HicB family nuclease
MTKILFEAKLPVSLIREGKQYIAYTPALDLSTAGKSYQEAKERFAEIVDIFFKELISKGTLDSVLSDLGWQHKKQQWQPPVLVGQELQTIKFTA